MLGYERILVPGYEGISAGVQEDIRVGVRGGTRVLQPGYEGVSTGEYEWV